MPHWERKSDDLVRFNDQEKPPQQQQMAPPQQQWLQQKQQGRPCVMSDSATSSAGERLRLQMAAMKINSDICNSGSSSSGGGGQSGGASGGKGASGGSGIAAGDDVGAGSDVDAALSAATCGRRRLQYEGTAEQLRQGAGAGAGAGGADGAEAADGSTGDQVWRCCGGRGSAARMHEQGRESNGTHTVG